MEVVASGLFGKYLRDALGIDRAATALEGDSGRILKLKDFYAHFLIFTIGVSVSTTCFLMMCCVHRTQMIREQRRIEPEASFRPVWSPMKSARNQPIEYTGRCRAHHLRVYRNIENGRTQYQLS